MFGCPGTHEVDQAGLETTLLLMSWDYRQDPLTIPGLDGSYSSAVSDWSSLHWEDAGPSAGQVFPLGYSFLEILSQTCPGLTS